MMRFSAALVAFVGAIGAAIVADVSHQPDQLPHGRVDVVDGAGPLSSISVPDLRGLSLDEALTTVEVAGLEVEGLIIGKGPTVIAQEPAPQLPVPPGAAVAITVGDAG